jgi:hypothetical protein
LKESGAVEEEFEKFQHSWTEGLRKGFEELTGDPEDYWRYGLVWDRIADRAPSSRLLRNSLLIGAVSDFEVLVSGLVRAFLALRPDIIRMAEQKYSISDLEPFSTLDEFREHCAENMADTLLRSGFDDWMDWFGKRHKIAVQGVTEDADELIEIFQRRHLLVHNGGVVNRFYLSKVGGDGAPKMGEKLGVCGAYLTKAVDELTVAGIKLSISLVRKLFSGQEGQDAISHRLGHITYELLTAGSWSVVDRVNEWELTFVQRQSSRLMATVNRWIAQKRLFGTDHIRAEVEGWDTDTLSGRFRLAKLALLDENEEAYDLTKALSSGGEIARDDWRDWPLLEGLRAYEVNTVDESERLFPVSFGDVVHSDARMDAEDPADGDDA